MGGPSRLPYSPLCRREDCGLPDVNCPSALECSAAVCGLRDAAVILAGRPTGGRGGYRARTVSDRADGGDADFGTAAGVVLGIGLGMGLGGGSDF